MHFFQPETWSRLPLVELHCSDSTISGIYDHTNKCHPTKKHLETRDIDTLKHIQPIDEKSKVFAHAFGEKIYKKVRLSKPPQIIEIDEKILEENNEHKTLVILFYVQWDSLVTKVTTTIGKAMQQEYPSPILFGKINTDIEFQLMSTFGFSPPSPCIGLSKNYGKTIDTIYTGNLGDEDDLYYWITRHTSSYKKLKEIDYLTIEPWRKLILKTNTVFLLGEKQGSIPKLVQKMFVKASTWDEMTNTQFIYIEKSQYTSQEFWECFSFVTKVPVKELLSSTTFELFAFNEHENRVYRYGFDEEQHAINPTVENEVSYRHILIPEWIKLKTKRLVHKLNPYTIKSVIDNAAYTVVLWNNYTETATRSILNEQFISLARHFQKLSDQNQYEEDDIASNTNLIVKGGEKYSHSRDFRLLHTMKLVQFGTLDSHQYRPLYERMLLPHLQQPNPLANFTSTLETSYPARIMVYEQGSMSIQALPLNLIENDWMKKQDAKIAIQGSLTNFVPKKRSQAIHIQDKLPYARHASYDDFQHFSEGVVLFHKHYCAACLPATYSFVEAIVQLDQSISKPAYLLYDVQYNDIPEHFSIHRVPVLIKFKDGQPVEQLAENLDQSETVLKWLST